MDRLALLDLPLFTFFFKSNYHQQSSPQCCRIHQTPPCKLSRRCLSPPQYTPPALFLVSVVLVSQRIHIHTQSQGQTPLNSDPRGTEDKKSEPSCRFLVALLPEGQGW